MKNIPVIDANIILRFLTDDEPVMAEKCRKLLERVERNEEQVYLPDIVLADIVWTLEKFYRVAKPRIREIILPVVGLKGLRCANKKIIARAFDLYANLNIDWTDSFVAASMLNIEQDTIYSYDKDFAKIENIRRLEPC